MKTPVLFLVAMIATLALAAPALADLTCEGRPDIDILLLHSECGAGVTWATTDLAGRDGIGTVGVFDIQLDTPDAGDLAGYDMVIVAVNCAPANRITTGDVVSAFAANHPVLMTGAAFEPTTWGLLGGVTALSPIVAGTWNMADTPSMDVAYDAHPALDGIASFSNQYYQEGTLASKAEPIAYYDDAGASVLLTQLDNVFYFNASIWDSVLDTVNCTACADCGGPSTPRFGTRCWTRGRWTSSTTSCGTCGASRIGR
jgi:hypothetical protein